MTDYTVRIKRYEAEDPRLGRHVRHDSRSLAYQVEAGSTAGLVSVRHQRFVPTFDQGQLGSCTGNASVGCIGTGKVLWTEPVQRVLSTTDAAADEKYAVAVYSAATKIDGDPASYPPTDTGSDGLSVAKVLKSQGLISGYSWATSLEALLTALSRQPVIVGTDWHQDMFRPTSDGQIKPTGSVDGGHEYCIDELDVENKRVWIHNSWGDGWGQGGRAWLSWDDMGTLLANHGDCTVFTAATAPAPTPSPVPAPTDAKAEFVAAAQDWISHGHTGRNRTFAIEVEKYLGTL